MNEKDYEILQRLINACTLMAQDGIMLADRVEQLERRVAQLEEKLRTKVDIEWY